MIDLHTAIKITEKVKKFDEEVAEVLAFGISRGDIEFNVEQLLAYRRVSLTLISLLVEKGKIIIVERDNGN